MYKDLIAKYIEDHKEELIEDVKTLIRIDSKKGEKTENAPFGQGVVDALNTALDMAKKYGFEVKNYDNYVGVADLNDKERALDILAHLDVVPEGEGWVVTKPFEPLVQDGKIYGRGSSDDKGPAIAALYALRAVKDLNIPLSKNTRLILGTDEEDGSACIRHYYSIEKEAPMTFTPDGEYPIVNIEKGRLAGHFIGKPNLTNGKNRLVSFKGGTKVNVVPPKAEVSLVGFDVNEIKNLAVEVEKETKVKFEICDKEAIKITSLGANAHASTPEKGNNAITAMILLLSKLDFSDESIKKLFVDLYNLMPHNQVDGENLGIKISDEKSGSLTLAFSIFNIDENGLEGYFDSRCPVSAKPDFILSTVREKFENIGLEFTNKDMVAPHEVDGNSDFIKTLNSCYEEYTGKKGGTIAIGGGTYVHNINNGVAFGAVFPETDTRMHGADEFMPIDELLASAKIFALAIVKLCS